MSRIRLAIPDHIDAPEWSAHVALPAKGTPAPVPHVARGAAAAPVARFARGGAPARAARPAGLTPAPVARPARGVAPVRVARSARSGAPAPTARPAKRGTPRPPRVSPGTARLCRPPRSAERRHA